MTNFDYYICGDYEVNGKIGPCLIRLAGNTEAEAQKVLAETVANPPAKCLGNIHIRKQESDKCWWNQGGLD